MKGLACSLTVLAVLAGAGTLAVQAPPDEQITVRVVGIRVVKESHGKDMMMAPFGGMKGTTLAVLVESKEKSIIDFDEQKTTLRSFKDNKEVDLRTSTVPTGKFRQPAIGFPRISEDGKAVLFELYGERLPTKGSSSVKAEGTVSLALGSELKSERQRNVPLRKGSKITVGPVPFEITKVEFGAGTKGPQVGPGGFSFGTEKVQPKSGEKGFQGPMGAPPFDIEGMFPGFGMQEMAMTLTLKATEDISRIAAISFYDYSGKKVESQVMRTSTMSGMGQVVVKQQIGLAKKLGTADIVVEFWKEFEHKEVPFSVEAGISLQ